MDFTSIYDSYTCWCFDDVVEVFGQAIEAAMAEVKGKNEKANAGRRENVLRKFLGMDQKFRSPGGQSAERVEAPFNRE